MQLTRRADYGPRLLIYLAASPERNRCVSSSACKLHFALERAKRAFLDTLDLYTLEDIIGDPTELTRLLEGPAA